jgi:hypothetical protein
VARFPLSGRKSQAPKITRDAKDRIIFQVKCEGLRRSILQRYFRPVDLNTYPVRIM